MREGRHRARTFCRRSICCARRGLCGLPRGPLRPSRERTPASCGRVEYSRMRRKTRVIQIKRAYFCAPLLTAPPRQSQLPNKAARSIAAYLKRSGPHAHGLYSWTKVKSSRGSAFPVAPLELYSGILAHAASVTAVDGDSRDQCPYRLDDDISRFRRGCSGCRA